MRRIGKVTAGILAGSLCFMAVAGSLYRSQAQGGSQKENAPVQVGDQGAATPARYGGMRSEEKTVRDAYARLMRYHTAARDEASASLGVVRKADGYITFGVNNLRTGFIDEIFGQPLSELVTPRGGEVINLKPNYLRGADGLAHASYDALWEALPEVEKSGKTSGPTVLQAVGEKYKGAVKYTSYEVTVSLEGKRRSYRAMALHFNPGRAEGKPETEILDNITTEMNTVLAERSPRVRSPWARYVRSNLHEEIVNSIRAKEQAGAPLIPADAPIGYLPGDDVEAAHNLLAIAADSCEPPPQPELTFSSSTLNSYLPTNGNSISFTATISPSTVSGIIRFEIFDISAYRGDAMNHGDQTTPDYDFSGSQSGFGAPVTQGSGASLVYTISTSSSVNSATVNVYSRDYGGRFKIRAFATIGGTEITGTHAGTSSSFAMAPRDDNNNNLPDAGWFAGTARINEPSTAPASDNDNNPTGDGTNGDGFTDFEEYRGVIVRGTHRRLNPFQKDLFILSELPQGIGDASASPVTKHALNSGELTTDRIVNFNSTNSGFGGNIQAHFNQHGQRIIDGGYVSSGLFGNAFVVGTPNNLTRSIEVYPAALREASPPNNNQTTVDSFDNAAIRSTLGHESGHGHNIPHYTFSASGGRLSVMITEYLPITTNAADSHWNNIPHTYDATDVTHIRIR